jgi:hypothetical protein
MFNVKVFLNPRDKVVLEATLYDLMKEIRRQEFMNVSARKIVGEGL